MNGHIRTAKTGRRKVKARRVIVPWTLDAYVEPNEVFAEAVRVFQEKDRFLVPSHL